jgi:hypothetical protein
MPRIIISLPLKHRREPLIGGAYPPVIPTTDEISSDEGFQFFHSHLLCVMPPIDEFFLHPRYMLSHLALSWQRPPALFMLWRMPYFVTASR